MTSSHDPGPVLVTGASGFLGAHLVRALCASGIPVTASVRDTSDLWRLEGIEGPLSVVTADMTDVAGLTQLCRAARPRTIFHLAGDTGCRRFAGDWAQVHRAMAANVTAPLNLLQAAQVSGAPVRRFIRTGSQEEYGSGPSPADENQREVPSSPYSASLMTTTHWLQMLQPHVDFSLITIRPALTYGPGQSHDFLIPALINALLKDERFATTGGPQKRDLLYVDDLIDAFQRVASGPDLGGHVLNISSETSYRMHDVAVQIAEMMGKEQLLDVGAAPARPMDQAELSGRIDRASTLLGWTPATGLTEGLRKTIDWYRNWQERPGTW